MPVMRVRELAHETLASLAPVSAERVDAGWRDQVADYLLNQQTPTDAASTRGHLRRSEAARAWSHSVLDSLSQLYSNGDMPTIPSGEGGAEPATREPRSARPARERTPATEEIIRRRRLLGAGAGAVLLLFVLLIWPIGWLGGDDDGGDDSAKSAQAGKRDVEILGQVVLRKAAGQNGAGIAIITRTGGKTEINLQAALNPTGQNEAYQVWLFNSPDDAKSLGAQVTDNQGRFAGRNALPANWRDYRYINVSREQVDDGDAGHSGETVLQAKVAAIRRPSGDAQQQP
jgi:hypothetical protein